MNTRENRSSRSAWCHRCSYRVQLRCMPGLGERERHMPTQFLMCGPGIPDDECADVLWCAMEWPVLKSTVCGACGEKCLGVYEFWVLHLPAIRAGLRQNASRGAETHHLNDGSL